MKRLVSTFEFNAGCRLEYDLTGGLRISEQNRLEVPRVDVQNGPSPSTPVYDLTQTYTARTPVFSPQAAVSWEIFSVRHPSPPQHPDPAITTPPYVVRFRVSDGSTDFYWDGAAWTAISLDTHWNTEAEVSTNISSFPIRDISFVVNMWTLHEDVTPALKSLKLLYQSDIAEDYDVIYESLIPEMKENIRGKSRLAYRTSESTTLIGLSDTEALGLESSYDITDVTAAYNYTTDPEKTADILSIYNSTSGLLTLASSAAANEVVWVNFEYRPAVAVQTSRDYSELSSLPGLDITNIEISNSTGQVNTSDGVIDITTDSGWLIPGPCLKNINFSIELTCDKQYDLRLLAQSVREWSQKKVLKIRGMDYEVSVSMLGDFEYDSVHNSKNMRTAKANFIITHVPFFDRPATQANSLQSIQFSGGNLTLTI